MEQIFCGIFFSQEFTFFLLDLIFADREKTSQKTREIRES